MEVRPCLYQVEISRTASTPAAFLAVLRDFFGLSWDISVQEGVEVFGDEYDGRFDQYLSLIHI